uniref:Uncharacterized protein n=1 Tax=Sphaerodactylus townsendi TaxID=933632 RepID=A0ACB8EHM6_9SAUR
MHSMSDGELFKPKPITLAPVSPTVAAPHIHHYHNLQCCLNMSRGLYIRILTNIMTNFTLVVLLKIIIVGVIKMAINMRLVIKIQPMLHTIHLPDFFHLLRFVTLKPYTIDNSRHNISGCQELPSPQKKRFIIPHSFQTMSEVIASGLLPLDTTNHDLTSKD